MKMNGFDTTIITNTSHNPDSRWMEFHISRRVRELCGFDEALFASTGNVILKNTRAVHDFVHRYNTTIKQQNKPELFLKSGQLNAMGLIDEVFHYVCRLYRMQVKAGFFSGALTHLEQKLGKTRLDEVLTAFIQEFPPVAVMKKEITATDYLAGSDTDGLSSRESVVEELMLLRLANENPAFAPFFQLFSDAPLKQNPAWMELWDGLRSWSVTQPSFGPEGLDLIGMLKAPVNYSPYSLKGQLEYIRTRWLSLLGDWLSRLLAGMDLISEEEKAAWAHLGGGDGLDMDPYSFGDISKEYERFSPDREWMPNVVLIAKSTLVWLDQLSKKYNRAITRLDQIPDEELDFLSAAGVTGLWLIGLWERSPASARIKQICGNPEAAASAYSLDDYDIANELGGWDALASLRHRAWQRGIRMASDMVPNHTGMDAKWVISNPDYFIQTRDCPFPSYDFSGENLSHNPGVGIYLENHYYSKSDCAVVFKRVDHHSGDVRYIYHGNDGTGMPWNDTAQIDFLNPEAREAVIQTIMHVARNFPIIRFDAAMVLAKKHIQRLWYPEPGHGGDIASRSQYALSRDDFEKRIPEEFWREVVDRCAREIPDTLLLAEAFWMMEGYFVRTLGMHRVYNSAFMNMLKREDNSKYRSTIKNTIEFDPEILKRYVNFMNNPDEETAVVQFGKGDKYFGVCTMMVAMPGLPMIGHGQIEGFEEKYGMEYRKAYRNEQTDHDLVERHRREIFPLMKKRYLFAGVENFLLYDFWENGSVNENVFVWSNRVGSERALIFFNNVYQRTSGWVKTSAAYAVKQGDGSKNLVQRTVGEGLGLTNSDDWYCLMQEQRSGLWFIRRNRDIHNSGLFASLDGFQTQVFVNIWETPDNEWGHYRTLHDTLAGGGVADVRMAIQNIFLKDLYTAMSQLLDSTFIQKIRDGSMSSAFLAERADVISGFFTKLLEFIGGNYGASGMYDSKKAGKVPTAAQLSSVFTERCLRLTGLSALASKPTADITGEAKAVLESMGTWFTAREDGAALYLTALLFAAVREAMGSAATGKEARDLVNLWCIDRKIAEFYGANGLGAPAIQSEIHLLKELMVATAVQSSPKTEVTLGEILNILFTAPEAHWMLGVNSWDGTVWYNKEQTEQVLQRVWLVRALNAPEFTAILPLVRKELSAFLAAQEASGYKVDTLLGSFNMQPAAEAKKKAAAPGKKAAAPGSKAADNKTAAPKKAASKKASPEKGKKE